jgi:Fe-S cluster biogenesis protein NfuA
MTPAEDDNPATLQDVLGELQSLIDELSEVNDPEVRRSIFRALDLIDVLHREGLERIVGGIASTGFLEKALDDPVVANLLGIYGLIPEPDPTEAVTEALVELAPYFESHGGNVRLVSVQGGVVDLAMEGACGGCPSAEITLTQAIEEAIRERWPGLVALRVADGHAPHGGSSQDDSSQWQTIQISTHDHP